MINITINGEAEQLEKALNISELLIQKKFISDKIAIAVNKTFVPRSLYAQHDLCDGDMIDIVSPIQGG